MAEYGGKQRNQLSKVTGSSKSKDVQPKRFIDNRLQTVSQTKLVDSIQKRYLPHEAWHVVQQMTGCVEPTTKVDGIPMNDSVKLEHEVDVMVAKALQRKSEFAQVEKSKKNRSKSGANSVVQSKNNMKEICEFVDNGIETVIQKKSLEIIHDSTLQKRIVQKYGILGNGSPGTIVVPVGTYLVHGTNVQQFLGTGGPKRTPDSPSWFALESRFSAHAGSRGGDPIIYLHNYRVTTAALDLLAFDDVTDLSTYLENNGYPQTDINGVDEANKVLSLNAGIDGYKLDRDAVRDEPEIILFNDGLGKLSFVFKSELHSEEEIAHGDDSDLGHRRRLRAGGKVIHTANPLDLSDFQTESDDKMTGHQRRYSF